MLQEAMTLSYHYKRQQLTKTLDSIFHPNKLITLSYHIHSTIAQANIACVYFHTSSPSYNCIHYFLIVFCSLNVFAFPIVMNNTDNQSGIDFTRSNKIKTLCYDSDCIECEYVDPHSLDYDSCVQPDDFSILQFNIRGLISKEEQLNRLLNNIGGVNKVGVIALNETWLRKENMNKVALPG